MRALRLAAFAAILAGLAGPAAATPLLALKEAENCKGCHNAGRGQKPVLERRCTLDCAGCHIDPSGAGPRNQWGYYYSQAELPPLTFFQPQDPLKDESRFDVHYDGRIIQRETEDKSRTFPMSSELSVRVRPFVEYLHLTYQALFLGRIDDDALRADRGDDRRFREKYAVMIDKIPMNLYVKAYRGPPLYGLRRANHSLWIRERTGLDQFATTDAVQLGGTPNVPYMHASQMLGDPYAEPEDKQKGTSFHGGFRGVTLGWHLNGSSWDTESEKAKIRMRALGAGLKPWKFLFMGERNWREVNLKTPTAAVASDFKSHALRLHPSSEITEWTAAFAGIPGVIVGGTHETLLDAHTDSQRRSVFVDLHPIPFVQIELWRRFEKGSRELADTLAVGHLYFDF